MICTWTIVQCDTISVDVDNIEGKASTKDTALKLDDKGPRSRATWPTKKEIGQAHG